MQILNNKLDLDSFYGDLKASTDRLLMLDYDGTLAPFVSEREKAVPYPEVVGTLEKLFDNERTRVVIISGRTVDDLKKLLATNRLPEIWGCHGLERLTCEGDYSIVQMSEDMRQRLAGLYDWTAQNNLVNFCEFKPSGGAFHWRGLPDDEAQQIHRKVVERWKDTADETSLELFEFDGGVEIRVAGTNKAVPVKTLLEDAGADVVSAYLGDDLTDEDAFRAIKGGGIAVLVKEVLRDTEADLWLTPPDELADFLTKWI